MKPDLVKSMIIAALTLACLAPTAARADRAVNTALGTAAGLLVFGPVGAVAGAAVGYTAGDGIARSWGLSRSHKPPRNVRRSGNSSGSN